VPSVSSLSYRQVGVPWQGHGQGPERTATGIVVRVLPLTASDPRMVSVRGPAHDHAPRSLGDGSPHDLTADGGVHRFGFLVVAIVGLAVLAVGALALRQRGKRALSRRPGGLVRGRGRPR
jgi:hypothetical protein